jgi:hypothetical protein
MRSGRAAHAREAVGIDAEPLRVVTNEPYRTLHILDRSRVTESGSRAMIDGEDGITGLDERRTPDLDLRVLERHRGVV